MIRVGMSQIVSSMRHRKSAYSSLVLEVALGCTVVAYSLGLGAALRTASRHPLGFDLSRTFSVTFEAPFDPAAPHAHEELAQLRALPGVEAAAWVELPPMSRRELPESVRTPAGSQLVWMLRGEASLVRVLDAHLADGRWLAPRDEQPGGPTPVLVTRALAERLGRNPVGSALSSPSLRSMSVVGVVDDELRLGPFYAWHAQLVIVPEQPVHARRSSYLLRTSAQASRDFARKAEAALAGHGARSVSVESLAQSREQFVRNVGGAESIIFITVMGMVLVVLVGSIGMASSLIVERRRQIGIRRALGARRSDIVGYFMLENLFATVLGIAIGAGCCLLLDQVLSPWRTMVPIAWRDYMPISAALFLVAGQISVLLPARRAACGSPCIVARVG